jgi:hypothetical protein
LIDFFFIFGVLTPLSKFFKTEISQNTDGNRGNFAYDDFARLEVERNTSTKANHFPKRQKTPEKFGPDISAVHMKNKNISTFIDRQCHR